jgi:DASS family divalent anion:Na+ symporter
MSALAARSAWIARGLCVALALVIWFAPPPEGLTVPAWRLFEVFAAAIFSVIVGAFPIFTASVLAVAATVMTGLLSPAQAYAGFANATILLIVVAFLVARAVVKCGLGQRLGHLVVSLFGRSTLGLSYSIFLVDGLIAPAFPSNTARGGVIYPLVVGLAEAGGATPENPARKRLGGYLMFSGMVSLSLSSALWFTAMAANPIGAEMARSFGVTMSFGSWLIASCVPTLAAMALLPWILQRIIAPEVKATPDAPAAAKRALAALGPLSRDERIVSATFVVMVALWAAAGSLGLDSTAIAFLGLGVLMATGVLTMGDIAKEGDVLATFIWFAVLYTLSGQLNEMGFMGYLGHRLAGALGGLGPIPVFLVLVVAYVLLHYLFVSQTAHVLALFAVFLEVGVKLGVPAAPLAYTLLFASNFFSIITPQGSSANLLFTGSGYLSQGELYRLGAITTGISLLVYLAVGTPWLLAVAR